MAFTIMNGLFKNSKLNIISYAICVMKWMLWNRRGKHIIIYTEFEQALSELFYPGTGYVVLRSSPGELTVQMNIPTGSSQIASGKTTCIAAFILQCVPDNWVMSKTRCSHDIDNTVSISNHSNCLCVCIL